MKSFTEKAWDFVTDAVWRERKHMRGSAGYLLKTVQVSFLVAKGFLDDKCFLRASALSYTTLLSLVPLLAFVFSILKGLGLDTELRPYLRQVAESRAAAEAGQENTGGTAAQRNPEVNSSAVPAAGAEKAAAPEAEQAEEKDTTVGKIMKRLVAGQGELVNKLVEYSLNYIRDTPVGALGVVSFLMLLYTVIKVLSTVENSLNDIWGVTRGRTWLRKVADYTSVTVIAPMLLIAAVGLSAYVMPGGARGEETAVELTVKAVGPYVLIWTAFTAFYAFMPNASVRFTSALAGGLVGGTMWQLAFWAYTTFQIGIAKYNVIYTSFAALPVFLMWLYISWLVVLFGAQVAFSTGHIETYRTEMQRFDPSAEAREAISMRVFLEIAGAFHRGDRAPSADDISGNTSIPLRAVREAVEVLSGAGLLSEVKTPGGAGYQPARELSVVTVAQVYSAARRRGDTAPVKDGDEAWRQTEGAVEEFNKSLSGAAMSKSILSLLGGGK